MRFETFKFFISACESSNKYTPQGVILLSSATTEKAAEAGWVTVGVVIFFVENGTGIRRAESACLHCDRIGKSPGSKPHWQNIWHCSFPAATLPARPGGKQRGGRSGSRHWHSEVQVTAGRHGEGAIESGAARTFKSASV